MTVTERFLKYVSYPTMSCSDSATVPSTAKQKILGADIAAELRALGLADAHTHSSVLAWRIPGTGQPGGLPSMGLHRVGHN